MEESVEEAVDFLAGTVFLTTIFFPLFSASSSDESESVEDDDEEDELGPFVFFAETVFLTETVLLAADLACS